jgi:hypothetical protein
MLPSLFGFPMEWQLWQASGVTRGPSMSNREFLVAVRIPFAPLFASGIASSDFLCSGEKSSRPESAAQAGPEWRLRLNSFVSAGWHFAHCLGVGDAVMKNPSCSFPDPFVLSTP